MVAILRSQRRSREPLENPRPKLKNLYIYRINIFINMIPPENLSGNAIYNISLVEEIYTPKSSRRWWVSVGCLLRDFEHDAEVLASVRLDDHEIAHIHVLRCSRMQ